MSEENVELVRRWMEAWNRGDVEGVEASFDYLDPGIEWDASGLAEMLPDIARVYRGKEGVRSFWRNWLSAWRDLRFDFGVRGAGDEVILLVRNQRQWGRHSGIETQIPPYAWSYTFREGKIVRVRFFPNQAEALEAAGLSE
jgi:ketosteroid isomerase-like protein